MKKNLFTGNWRIYELSDFDEEYMDMEEPAYIELDSKSSGEFHFGLVYAQLHYEREDNIIQFTFEGNDEFDQISGRGKAECIEKELHGLIVFHGGDKTTFKAKPSKMKIKIKR